MKYCWCTIMVRDLDASLAFYQNVLGLKIGRRFQSPDGADIVFLSDGDSAEVELIRNEKAVKYEGRGLSLGFQTPNLADAMAAVKAKGIEIVRGPIKVGGGTEFFYVRDPDGVEIQIVSHGA
jgi:lactoylglutathione lyase